MPVELQQSKRGRLSDPFFVPVMAQFLMKNFKCPSNEPQADGCNGSVNNGVGATYARSLAQEEVQRSETYIQKTHGREATKVIVPRKQTVKT